MKATTIHFTDSNHAGLKLIASCKGRSLAEVANEAAEAYIKLETKTVESALRSMKAANREAIAA